MRATTISILTAAILIAAPGAPAQQEAAKFAPPAADAVPAGPLGDAIRLGGKIVNETRTYAGAYVRAAMNCSSCHLDGGRREFTAPFVGLWGVFPEYYARSGRVETLAARINDCFERSLNGRRVPLDAPEMGALLAYIWWLSKDVPTGVPVTGRGFLRIAPTPQPSATRGQAVYRGKCAACHGAEGAGVTGADGKVVFPPLWGPSAFNIAAGMARLDTAASFVKVWMPEGHSFSLTNEEAYDVAAFFTRQPRPDFPDKSRDWPYGGKPADARY